MVALHEQLIVGDWALDLDFAALRRVALVELIEVYASELVHGWADHLRAELLRRTVEHQQRVVQVLALLAWQLSQ